MRIAVTGIGIVSPVGIGTELAWKAIREGRSGIGEPTLFEPGDLPITVVGEVPDFDPTAVASAKEARRLDRNVLLAMTAAKEAVDEADLSGFDRERIGVLVGSAIGGFLTILEQHDIMRERGWSRVAPHFFPATLVDTASGAIATMLDLQGPNYAPCSACATGAHAIGEAAELLRRGGADAVVAGGVEACLHPLLLAGFTTMKGLGTARPGEPAETASRPFDATRNGFVCSEGSTIVVLEPLDEARRARRAHPRRGDRSRQLERRVPRGRAASRVARPDPDDEPRARLGRHRAGRGRLHQRAWHVDAAGRRGRDLRDQDDLRRARLRAGGLLDEGRDRPPVRCRRRVRDGHVHARLSRRHPPADAALPRSRPRVRPRLRDRGRARRRDLSVAMSNSIGLGGHNGCVLVRRYDG